MPNEDRSTDEQPNTSFLTRLQELAKTEERFLLLWSVLYLLGVSQETLDGWSYAKALKGLDRASAGVRAYVQEQEHARENDWAIGLRTLEDLP